MKYTGDEILKINLYELKIHYKLIETKSKKYIEKLKKELDSKKDINKKFHNYYIKRFENYLYFLKEYYLYILDIKSVTNNKLKAKIEYLLISYDNLKIYLKPKDFLLNYFQENTYLYNLITEFNTNYVYLIEPDNFINYSNNQVKGFYEKLYKIDGIKF